MRKQLLRAAGDPADGECPNNTFAEIRSTATAAPGAILQLREFLLCVSCFLGNSIKIADNIVVVCLCQLHFQAVCGAVSQVKLLFGFLESLLRLLGIQLQRIFVFVEGIKTLFQTVYVLGESLGRFGQRFENVGISVSSLNDNGCFWHQITAFLLTL